MKYTSSSSNKSSKTVMQPGAGKNSNNSIFPSFWIYSAVISGIIGISLCFMAASAGANGAGSKKAESSKVKVLRELVKENPQQDAYRMRLAEALYEVGEHRESAQIWMSLCRESATVHRQESIESFPRQIASVAKHVGATHAGNQAESRRVRLPASEKQASIKQENSPSEAKPLSQALLVASRQTFSQQAVEKPHRDPTRTWSALSSASGERQHKPFGSKQRSATRPAAQKRINIALKTLQSGNGPEDSKSRHLFTNSQSNRQPVAKPLQQLLKEGLQAAEEQRYDDAISTLEKVIALDPTRMNAWQTLGWAYWENGQKEQTMILWKRLEKLCPQRPEVQNLLGKAYIQRDELDEARQCFERSLKIEPNQPEIRYAMARVLRWTGNASQALIELRRLKSNPTVEFDLDAELARALKSNQDYDTILPLWQKLRQREPNNPEFMLAEAEALLHTNVEDDAVFTAEKVIANEPNNKDALILLADAYQYGKNDPKHALYYLKQLSASEKDPKIQSRFQLRTLQYMDQLNQKDPAAFPIENLETLIQEVLAANQAGAEALIYNGELLKRAGRLKEADMVFTDILHNYNPSNRRALEGRFEVALSNQKCEDAEAYLTQLAAFNSDDPYLHYKKARLAMAQGQSSKAMAEIEKLEQRGRKGAVAVLLYHGLANSNFMEAMPVDTFREQIQAVRKAGFKIMTVKETMEFLANPSNPTLEDPDENIDLRVCITFDDARRDAMQLGTEVARDENLVFAMHIPTDAIKDEEDSYHAHWQMLRECAPFWEYGSHLHEAHANGAIDKENQPGHLLTNKVWLPKLGRLENLREYETRTTEAFFESKRLLREKLGVAADFIAYPFGDVGQENASNVSDAISRNLTLAHRAYKAGFIQTHNGYAVSGDNPLLYQRFSPDRDMSGQALVQHLLENHPVLLAQRLRTEYAAQQGKPYLAQQSLAQLEQNGYPEDKIRDLDLKIYRQLRNMPPPADLDTGQPQPPALEKRNSYVAGLVEFFEDNQDRTNWEIGVAGGSEISKSFELSGKVTHGKLKQDTDETNVDEYNIDQESLQIGAAYRFKNGLALSADAIYRKFSGDYDDDFIGYRINADAKATPYLGLYAQFEHDIVPAARAVAEDIDYDSYLFGGTYRLRDWWSISANLSYYDFSDSNSRKHFGLGTNWLLSEKRGWYVGLNYAYADADEDDTDIYWTPDNMHRAYAETGIVRGNGKAEYALKLKLGIGKENSDEDDEGWEPVYGVAAEGKLPLSENLSLNAGLSYNAVPDYNEMTIQSNLRYDF